MTMTTAILGLIIFVALMWWAFREVKTAPREALEATK